MQELSLKTKQRLNRLTIILIFMLVMMVTMRIGIGSSSGQVSAAPPAASPTPIPGPVYNVKVLSVSYFPIVNGVLDTTIVNNSYNEYNMTLDEVRAKVDRLNQQVSASLTENTAYRQYFNPVSNPELSYTVARYVENLTAMPMSTKSSPYNVTDKLPDYTKIINDLGGCSYIEQNNIKEVWIWGYSGYNKGGWESNFWSRAIGDVSNSDRDPNDLPKCRKSYTVYEYNYGRDVPEAMEDHMHQLEAMWGYLNNDLFWNQFVGPTGTGDTGRRCGSTHFPPNADYDYDWANLRQVSSDCRYWQPAGGQTEIMDCNTWGCTNVGFFKMWMQSVPGINNGMTYQGRALKDWWSFIGDFDNAIKRGINLVQ
jgi:hypothetical protein